MTGIYWKNTFHVGNQSLLGCDNAAATALTLIFLSGALYNRVKVLFYCLFALFLCIV